jgi:endonuclease/exonuclease/phosphatase family metal-dependent hydrolase
MESQNRVVRVLTWNIHKGLGLDGRRDLERIVARISRHEPDVIAVQEVDARQRGISSFAILRGGSASTAPRPIRSPRPTGITVI